MFDVSVKQLVGCVLVGTRPRERAKKLLFSDEMRDCARYVRA